MKRRNAPKPPRAFSPLDCEMCMYRDRCINGIFRAELYRCGCKVYAFECARLNGGRLLSEHTEDGAT